MKTCMECRLLEMCRIYPFLAALDEEIAIAHERFDTIDDRVSGEVSGKVDEALALNCRFFDEEEE